MNGYQIVSETIRTAFDRGVKSARLQTRFLQKFKQRMAGAPPDQRNIFLDRLMQRLQMQADKRGVVFGTPVDTDAYSKGFYGTLRLIK